MMREHLYREQFESDAEYDEEVSSAVSRIKRDFKVLSVQSDSDMTTICYKPK